ncbi:alpha/beta fold hydrolase [Nonomuraea rhodomycinica]|uniref:Alpha/beta hydrolase n=1 Tax=Nonomuraea rhodomycinica TaxID=1712872 RepID=A0A7Y6IPJ9_9ACTN|nr:alpha/beta hydrolase [Nonomuraea rhodomycinica]NUW41955.1 alpha/beta hydrolase [Nonomuraea rhodomycinica]
MTTTHTITVPGARITYDVRGDGPVLVLAGFPMTAGPFAALAQTLADHHTVVTFDPRGMGRSPADDPGQGSTPERRADDVAAVLDAIGADDADFLGSSGGGITGLALAARRPERVRVLVAHEPPLFELLPDVAERRAAVERVVATHRSEGVRAALARFMTDVVGHDPAMGENAARHSSEQDLADFARLFALELRSTTGHVPDLAALAGGRVVVGVGAASARLVTSRTSLALAARLGLEPVEFPGGHGGFRTHPEQFAEVLRRTLAAHP